MMSDWITSNVWDSISHNMSETHHHYAIPLFIGWQEVSYSWQPQAVGAILNIFTVFLRENVNTPLELMRHGKPKFLTIYLTIYQASPNDDFEHSYPPYKYGRLT